MFVVLIVLIRMLLRMNIIQKGLYIWKRRVDSKIKRYLCKHCEKGFSADISSMIDKNFSVSNEIKDSVQKYYSFDYSNVRKIQEIMKKFHMLNCLIKKFKILLVIIIFISIQILKIIQVIMHLMLYGLK